MSRSRCRAATAEPAEMSDLSELLRAANSKNLSGRSIALAAQDLGFSLNHDTAARYLRGDHGRPAEATLRALSSVLDVPLAELRSAAALPTEVTEPYRPPMEASQLNRRQRRAVDEVIRAMLAAPPLAQPVTELRPKPGRQQTRPRAARRGSIERPLS
jgi:transcriptional regulator with XRE-family HTH domain